jgi:uncharacterized pyridoxamine 5'-phosphate oxidase family protein
MANDLTWSEVIEASRRLGRNASLATVDRSGRPHVAIVWVVAVDDRLHLVSDRTAAKARNLSTNPLLAIHFLVSEEHAGEQLFLRGRADFVEDPGRRLALWDSGAWGDLSTWYGGPLAPELAFVAVDVETASLTANWGNGPSRRWRATVP